MKKAINNFFYKNGDVNGEPRWLPLLTWFSILTIIGIISLSSEIGTSFAERFLKSGIFMILGPAAGIAFWIYTMKAYEKEQDGRPFKRNFIIGAALFWSGLFGPNVGFKEDRKASIPDNPVYYFNGKVQNATDPSKKNYYFDEFKLNPVDSAYVVQWGEEPGYNNHNGYKLKGNGPRADEDWQRPVSKNAQKFVDGKRN